MSLLLTPLPGVGHLSHRTGPGPLDRLWIADHHPFSQVDLGSWTGHHWVLPADQGRLHADHLQIYLGDQGWSLWVGPLARPELAPVHPVSAGVEPLSE